MNSNESVQFHMRFVTEKHQELIISIDELVKALVGEKLESKKALAQISLQKSNDLKASVSSKDCPHWLPGLISGLGHFTTGGWKQENLIDHIIKNLATIKGHVWVFEKQTEVAFDFDSIFEHYKKESRLPELFDEIIQILEEIKESGEIDSISMMNSLGKIISTIKKNKNGSYFSLSSVWECLVAFLKNYLWEELSNIPVLGTAFNALLKTIEDTNEEMSKVYTQIQKEMSRTVETEIKVLTNKTSFKFLGYDKSGATSDANNTSLSVSTTA